MKLLGKGNSNSRATGETSQEEKNINMAFITLLAS